MICAIEQTALLLNRLPVVGRIMGFEAKQGLHSHHLSKTAAATTLDHSYEAAVQALNQLQTNASVVRQSIMRPHDIENDNIQQTAKYLQRVGVSLEDLDRLSVIHVAGTKGKGSTCALAESILRLCGYKTGFYSSPHLVSVTERIRLCGVPISRDNFAKYFWRVYNAIWKQREYEEDLPPYFKFLTVMSFYVFLKENVDVAIIETGIGGEFDCTNVLRNTKTVGITSLGLEHTQLLGNTLQDIAWQKAGIIKPKSDVFTVAQQPLECLEMIRQRSNEKQANFYMVPNFGDYHWKRIPKLDIDIPAQKLNASLALQLAYNWIYHNRRKEERLNGNGYHRYKLELDTSDVILRGLEKCKWPGRCQTLTWHNVSFFFDGAHTKESIQICSEWFKTQIDSSKLKRILVFNTTGDRNYPLMLEILHKIGFDQTFFVPNVANSQKTDQDNVSLVSSEQEKLQKCFECEKAWRQINGDENGNRSRVFSSFSEILAYLKSGEEVNVLITGSLHLVGAALSALESYEQS